MRKRICPVVAELLPGKEKFSHCRNDAGEIGELCGESVESKWGLGNLYDPMGCIKKILNFKEEADGYGTADDNSATRLFNVKQFFPFCPAGVVL